MPINRKILLNERPEGMPDKHTFTFTEEETGEPGENQVLIRTIYASVDPYMRGRMENVESYVEPYQLQEVIAGGVVGEVVESKSAAYEKGDIVLGSYGWQTHYIAEESEIRKIDASIAPMSAHLGILGMTGLTAYFGLLKIGKPQAGETVVVSGAAGAVGSTVGQIAKIQGARVVGIAGTDEKCDYLKNELHFDATINYQETDNLEQALKDACPDKVDVYYDNVGGEISDAVLTQLNRKARVVVCGAISAYNLTKPDVGPRVQSILIKKSASMEGFTVGDFSGSFKEGAEQMAKWLAAGQLTYRETIREGFDSIPDVFLSLFSGDNIGKLVVKVSEPQEQQ